MSCLLASMILGSLREKEAGKNSDQNSWHSRRFIEGHVSRGAARAIQ